MALPAENVLIIGGGFSGMSAAITLRRLGVNVDLVEIDPDWRTDGAGITVSGPSLRAIAEIGVLEQFKAHGAINDGVELCDSAGNIFQRMTAPPVPGSQGITGSGGIMRPVLAKILADATLASGTKVDLGVTFNHIEDKGDKVTVSLSNGDVRDYDLVIAADGVFSSVRKALFPDAPVPSFTGQGVWRAVVPRYGAARGAMYLGRQGKIGYTPVSDEEMYIFYTEARPTKDRFEQSELLPHLKGLLEEYTAPVVCKIREGLNESSRIIYRPLEGMLMPRPWYKGRVLLIGDCVHATTPHLASGAGMGHEDAVVIAAEFARGGSLEQVLERYQNRRWERCRMVVTNSARLGEIEKVGGPPEEHTQLMALSNAAMLAPI
ncbi:MAG: FAD-dependent oxidoreductase [Gammaproteobacteria bacterium]|nr:FAD-dependent oxidoreductase [Gammaproteobacteria bacterium]